MAWRVWAWAMACQFAVGRAAPADDAAAARPVLTARFDRPDAPLLVEPVVSHGDYAVADWTQQQMGGRALLQKRQGDWILLLCGGDALRGPAGLRQAGLPDDVAHRLAATLQAAEATVDPERLAALSRFGAVAPMD